MASATHLRMNDLKVTNGLIEYESSILNRRIKASHPEHIEFDAGEAVAAFLSIERTLCGLDADLICFAAKEGRQLAIRHPDLRQ